MSVIGSTIAVLWVTLVVTWFMGTPRIKAWLWRNLPTLPKLLHASPPEDVADYEKNRRLVIPADWEEYPEVDSWHVNLELVEREWLPETEDFSRRSAHFWNAVRDQFGAYGTMGEPTTRSYLDSRVRAAAWPDEILKVEGDWEWELGESLSPEYSAFLLLDFVRRLYMHEEAPFEKERRELAILVKRWWTRAQADSGFPKWLAPTLGPVNLSTTKLLWYVEVARAESLKNQSPDYRPYELLREALYRHQGAQARSAFPANGSERELHQ